MDMVSLEKEFEVISDHEKSDGPTLVEELHLKYAANEDDKGQTCVYGKFAMDDTAAMDVAEEVEPGLPSQQSNFRCKNTESPYGNSYSSQQLQCIHPVVSGTDYDEVETSHSSYIYSKRDGEMELALEDKSVVNLDEEQPMLPSKHTNLGVVNSESYYDRNSLYNYNEFEENIELQNNNVNSLSAQDEAETFEAIMVDKNSELLVDNLDMLHSENSARRTPEQMIQLVMAIGTCLPHGGKETVSAEGVQDPAHSPNSLRQTHSSFQEIDDIDKEVCTFAESPPSAMEMGTSHGGSLEVSKPKGDSSPKPANASLQINGSPLKHRRNEFSVLQSPVGQKDSQSPVRRRGSSSPVKESDSRTPVKRVNSPVKRENSPVKQKVSPSPAKRKDSPFRRRRSQSPARRRGSRSPVKRKHSRSPVKRKDSQSPLRRKDSRSPVKRKHSRSPVKHKDSRSPLRRKDSCSPLQRRHSRSPVRRRGSRSPARRRNIRSPGKRRDSRSPIRWRDSRSPVRQRDSRSPVRRKNSRSPVRRRDSPSRSRRDYHNRSRSRSPFAGYHHRRSPRRFSPRHGSPAGYHVHRRSRQWSPPPNRSTGLGKPGKNLFVAGFSFLTTERDLERKFSKFGRVRDIRIVRDRRSGDSRGFGFLSMQKDEDADAAIRALDSTEWNGRIILVEKSKPTGR